jgi:hypothetical protein
MGMEEQRQEKKDRFVVSCKILMAFEMPNPSWGCGQKKKSKSNARKRSGDNENAILWTPLLTPFAQTDMLAP